MKQYRMNHDASSRVFSLLTIGDNGAMTMEHHYYEHTEVYEQVTMKYIWVIGERTEVKNGKTVCLKKFLPGMGSGRWELVVNDNLNLNDNDNLNDNESPNDRTTNLPNDQTANLPNDQTANLLNDQTTNLPNGQTTNLPNDQTDEPFIDTERIKEFCKKPMVKDIGLVLGATAGTLLILHLGLALPFAVLGLIAGGILK